MLKKLPILLFPLTILSTMNNTLANSIEESWYNYGFTVGTFTQTCIMAVDQIISTKDARTEMKMILDDAKETLDQNFYQYFTEFAYEEKDCIEFLP